MFVWVCLLRKDSELVLRRYGVLSVLGLVGLFVVEDLCSMSRND